MFNSNAPRAAMSAGPSDILRAGSPSLQRPVYGVSIIRPAAIRPPATGHEVRRITTLSTHHHSGDMAPPCTRDRLNTWHLWTNEITGLCSHCPLSLQYCMLVNKMWVGDLWRAGALCISCQTECFTDDPVLILWLCTVIISVHQSCKFINTWNVIKCKTSIKANTKLDKISVLISTENYFRFDDKMVNI